jgi:hypothetical protein
MKLLEIHIHDYNAVIVQHALELALRRGTAYSTLDRKILQGIVDDIILARLDAEPGHPDGELVQAPGGGYVRERDTDFWPNDPY